MTPCPHPYAPLGFVYHGRVGETPFERGFIERELMTWEHAIASLADAANAPPLIRFVYSWADAERPQGHTLQCAAAKRLSAAGGRIMPCIMWAPPGKTIGDIAASPPHPSFYAHLLHKAEDFLGAIEPYAAPYAQYGAEINGNCYWWRADDPFFTHFAVAHRVVAHLLRQYHETVVLSGPVYDRGNGARWLNLMCRYRVLDDCGALGIHTFPGTWADEGQTLVKLIGHYDAVQGRHGYALPYLICETSFATSPTRTEERMVTLERAQATYLEALIDETTQHPELIGPPLWHSLCDLPRDIPSAISAHEGTPLDPREHACGLWRDPETPKPAWHALLSLVRHPT